MSHGTKCNKGHPLKHNPAKNVKVCDACNKDVEKGETVWRCITCDFDMCVACHTAKNATDKAKHAAGVKSIFAKKSSVDKTSSSANTKHFFAFHGFDISSDPFEIFMVTPSGACALAAVFS